MSLTAGTNRQRIGYEVGEQPEYEGSDCPLAQTRGQRVMGYSHNIKPEHTLIGGYPCASLFGDDHARQTTDNRSSNLGTTGGRQGGSVKDRLLNPREAATLLGFLTKDGDPDVKSLVRQRRAGHIPFVRLPRSRLIKYRLSTLMQLIEERRTVPRVAAGAKRSYYVPHLKEYRSIKDLTQEDRESIADNLFGPSESKARDDLVHQMKKLAGEKKESK